MQLFIYQLYRYIAKKPRDSWQGENSNFLKMDNVRKYNLYCFLVEAGKWLL